VSIIEVSGVNNKEKIIVHHLERLYLIDTFFVLSALYTNKNLTR
jgi:hypothetical protein